MIAGLGGGELALREHLAGYRSHSSLLAGVAAFVAVTAVALGLGPVKLWVLVAARGRPSSPLLSTRCASSSSAAPAASGSDERAPPADRGASTTSRSSCNDVERSLGFYRNLLGMRLVKQTVNEDDQGARHLIFGDEEGRPGTLITCLEYPDLDEGTVGRGSTHHFALAVESEEELGGLARLPDRARHPRDRGDGPRPTSSRSTCAIPDGHIVEIATTGPGLTADEPLEELGRKPSRWRAMGGRPLPGRPCALLRSGGRQRAFASRQRAPRRTGGMRVCVRGLRGGF